MGETDAGLVGREARETESPALASESRYQQPGGPGHTVGGPVGPKAPAERRPGKSCGIHPRGLPFGCAHQAAARRDRREFVWVEDVVWPERSICLRSLVISEGAMRWRAVGW